MFFDLPNDTNDISSNEHLATDSSFLCYWFYEIVDIDGKSLLRELNQENRFPDWAMVIRTGLLGWTIDSG